MGFLYNCQDIMLTVCSSHSSPCAKVSLVKHKPFDMSDLPCLRLELQQDPCQAQVEETTGGHAPSRGELGQVGAQCLLSPPAPSTDPPFSQDFSLFCVKDKQEVVSL